MLAEWRQRQQQQQQQQQQHHQQHQQEEEEEEEQQEDEEKEENQNQDQNHQQQEEDQNHQQAGLQGGMVFADARSLPPLCDKEDVSSAVRCRLTCAARCCRINDVPNTKIR